VAAYAYRAMVEKTKPTNVSSVISHAILVVVRMRMIVRPAEKVTCSRVLHQPSVNVTIKPTLIPL